MTGAVSIPGEAENIAGRVAVVTGASRGIGLATAVRLAECGAALVLVARSTEKHPHQALPGTLEEATTQVRERGAAVLPVNADLRSPGDTQRVIDATITKFGGCDVLINNAAFILAAPILTVPASRWLQVLRVNAVAPLQLIQGFIPGMLERGFGRILNVSSEASPGSLPDLFMYGSSKQCLDRLTVDLNRECGGRGVSVNSVQVGFTDTPRYRYAKESGVTAELESRRTDPVWAFDPIHHVAARDDWELPFEPRAVADAFAWIVCQDVDCTGRVFTLRELVDLGALARPDAQE